MSESIFDPENPLRVIKPVHWHFTPILPLVFGYELSYMEQVAKLVAKLNEVISNDNQQVELINGYMDAFEQLHNEVMGRAGAWITGEMLKGGIITTDHLTEQCVTNENLDVGAVRTSNIHNWSIIAEHIEDGAVGQAALANGAVVAGKLGADAVESRNIADGAILSQHLGEKVVQTSSIADGAVTSDKIGVGAVGTDNIANLAITWEKLADGCVDRHHISAGSVGTSQIACGAIIGDHFGEHVVDTIAIADNAITGDKLNQLSVHGNTHILDYSIPGMKLMNGAIGHGQLGKQCVKSMNIYPSSVELMHLSAEAKNRLAPPPLVLYGVRENKHPAMYLDDPTYGDQALTAILQGRQILVRVPNQDMVGDVSACYAEHNTYLFSPVLTYQLPNVDNDYLYLFYLRDEKQVIDLSALGMGAINVPVYGELKMKLSVKYDQCPLEYVDARIYGDMINENIT